MGGGRGKYKSGASQKLGTVQVRKAIVTAVDKKRWTCTIEYPDGQPIGDVPVEPFMVNSRTGGGSFYMPEKGGMVWICKPSVGSAPFIMGGATAPNQTDEGDDLEDPSDRRFNRPQINDGDHALSISDEGHVIMRKGGMLELGAGPVCKSVYIPITNILREFTQNWEQIFGGGRMSFLSRDQDETYGEGRNPTEFQLQIKEFAEDRDDEDQNDYVVDIRLGRIENEDDEQVLGGEIGGCVARININDLYTVWVDREGNYQCKVRGRSTTEYHNKVERIHHSSLSEIVDGLVTAEYQKRDIIVHGDDTKRIERSKGLTVLGNVSETISGSVTRNTGKLEEYIKGIARTVAGTVQERVTGSVEQSIGDTRNVSVMGDSAEIVGGAKSTTVGNAQNPNPLGDGYKVTVYNGVFSLHDVTGKVVFTSGGPTQDAALAHVLLKPTGAVVIKPTKIGQVKFEVNNTGVQIKTPAGEISIDNAGTVEMGVGPAKGAVLTTLTHPVCLMNGAPIFGCSSVRAGGIPEPGVPPVSIPSTFVPDPSP
jgi:hypothetical protein